MQNFQLIRERTEQQAEYKYRITCVREVAEDSIISVAHTAGNEANQVSYLSLIFVEKQPVSFHSVHKIKAKEWINQNIMNKSKTMSLTL